MSTSHTYTQGYHTRFCLQLPHVQPRRLHTYSHEPSFCGFQGSAKCFLQISNRRVHAYGYPHQNQPTAEHGRWGQQGLAVWAQRRRAAAPRRCFLPAGRLRVLWVTWRARACTAASESVTTRGEVSPGGDAACLLRVMGASSGPAGGGGLDTQAHTSERNCGVDENSGAMACRWHGTACWRLLRGVGLHQSGIK